MARPKNVSYEEEASKHVIDFIAITSMQAIDLTADSPIDLGD